MTEPPSRDRPVPQLPPENLVLRTPRLELRPLTLEDEDLAVALFTDPEVVRYVCDVYTPEAIKDHLPVEVERGAGGRIGIWTAKLIETGAKIGTGVLLPLPIDAKDTDWSLLVHDRYPDAEIEVGYMLLPGAWGQGFATEICVCLLQFAFEHMALDEIKAVTDPGNLASQRVLQKCGLAAEGMRRAYGEDCAGFGITRRAWGNTAQGRGAGGRRG